MSVEQVARDLISNITDPQKVFGMVTADAMASGGLLPQAVPVKDAFNVTAGMISAFPDIKYEVQQVTLNGNQATVKVNISGTQTGMLSLPIPGFQAVPPTGKKVWARDAYILTVQGDKVSHFQIDSPADGGIPAMLAQLGVKMPGR
jgi:predicted ester cyclase